jgi:hypothetical protein
MTFVLNQENLRLIVTYDHETTRLIPRHRVPQGLPLARKHGKHQLYIDSKTYSMKKLAALYHHGAASNRITQLDGNKDNYAPDNLSPYTPTGRRDTRPIPDALKQTEPYSGGVYYQPILRCPRITPYAPINKFIMAHDQFGNALRSYSKEQAKRLALECIKHMTDEDRIRLGMISPNHVENITI